MSRYNPPPSRPFRPLLPTLFDRLRDDSPSAAVESAAAFMVTATQLREIVQRDIGFLLNATSADDLYDRRTHGAVAASTVNFGVRPLAGGHASDRRWTDIERNIRRALTDHEPRLVPGTVRLVPVGAPHASRNEGIAPGVSHAGHVLHFEIHALIDARPYPLALTVQSAVDLDTSRVRVKQAPRASTVPDGASEADPRAMPI